MGKFNDLPQDVKWLILRRVLTMSMGRHAYMWEEGYNTLPKNVADNTWNTGTETRKLALINKACLKVVKSKCFLVPDSDELKWLFVKGALTGNYS